MKFKDLFYDFYSGCKIPDIMQIPESNVEKTKRKMIGSGRN
jgi:hypothetical protein